MRVATDRFLLLIAVTLGALLVACSSGDDSPDPTSAGSSPSTTATEGASSTPGDGQPENTATPPGWVSDALDQQESVRFVAATGGVGVSHRSACDDGARIDGSWPEGAELEVVLAGDANCAEWTLMTDGDITSWVRNRYLSETQPAVRSAGGGASSGSTGSGSSSSSRQVEVIDFFGKLIPTAQLVVKPQTYTYVGTTRTAGCEASWHPVGDSVVALSGQTLADPAPDGCGFGAVHITPAYWVTAN